MMEDTKAALPLYGLNCRGREAPVGGRYYYRLAIMENYGDQERIECAPPLLCNTSADDAVYVHRAKTVRGLQFTQHRYRG